MATTDSPSSHLCKGAAILGRKAYSTRKPRPLPFGRKCCGAKGDSVRTCHIHQLGCCLGFGGNSPGIHKLATLFSCMLSPLVEGQDFMETTIHTASPIADEDAARCTTPPSGTERENWCLLVITATVGQLSLGPGGDNPERSITDSHGGNTFQNPQIAAIFSGSTRAVSYESATV